MGKIVSGVMFDEFARVFRHNLNSRSRTAKGVSDVSASPGKKPLVLSGPALEQQVAHNTNLLVLSVWKSDKWEGQGTKQVRELVESWNQLVNNGLQIARDYRDEQEEVYKRAKELAERTGKRHHLNRLYRVVTPPYLAAPLPPEEIEVAMDQFYLELLANTILAYFNELPQEELLAWVDYQMEKAIHPWADGCGRTATAIVMWLSLLDPERFRFPVFGTRDEHYAALKAGDLQGHAAYYKLCLERDLPAI